MCIHIQIDLHIWQPTQRRSLMVLSSLLSSSLLYEPKLNCSSQCKGQIVIWYDIIRFLRSHPCARISEKIVDSLTVAWFMIASNFFLGTAVVVFVFDHKKFPWMIYWPLSLTAHSFIAYAWDFFCICLIFVFSPMLNDFSVSARISLFYPFTWKLPEIWLFFWVCVRACMVCVCMLYSGQILLFLIACKSLSGFFFLALVKSVFSFHAICFPLIT